ncbi:MAG TPA: hypothetical protein VF752_08135, partial [Thermoleophilaceae bacterium]
IARVVLEGRARTLPRPVTAPKRRLGHSLALGTACVALLAFSLSSDDTFPVFARAFDLHPETAVATTRPEVGLLVLVDPSQVPAAARALERRGMRASFVVATMPRPGLMSALQPYGDDAIPQLDSRAFVHWVGAKRELRQVATAVGYGKHYRYVSGDGFSLGEYVLAHSAGGLPVGPAVTITGPATQKLAAGQLVQVRLAGPQSTWAPTLDALASDCQAARLHTLSARQLLVSSGDRSSDQLAASG